ncbi:MAG: YeeE/YedE family protein [Hyphomicrobiales bacterium]|nr:YeeE/YedE family protein [Hyphomicrobiales bacterium]MDE2018387.1 YeeE/YedE family protein [Hyphomicrobiales bacterium]
MSLQIVQPLIGGILIGGSAVLLMATQGRIAGISGLLRGAFSGEAREGGAWRIAFLVGLIAAVPLASLALGRSVVGAPAISPLLLTAAGILVGVGVSMANGCTSGHGVCGNARLSSRSLVATLTFMATGAATVFVLRHVVGA